MEEILITGASGFLGSHVYSKLKEMGLPVSGFTRSKLIAEEKSLNYVNTYLDIPKKGILLHFAENPYKNEYEENEESTKTQLLTVRELSSRKYNKLVYASTSLLYPNIDQEIDESFEIGEVSHPYSKYKIESEECFKRNKNSVIVRLTNLFGRGMSTKNVLSEVLNKLSEPSITVRNAKAQADFLYVEDAVEAIIGLALSKETGVFNICSGLSYKIEEIIKMMCSIKKNPTCEIKSLKEISTHPIQVRNEKIRNKINWSPKYSLEEGLEKLLKETK